MVVVVIRLMDVEFWIMSRNLYQFPVEILPDFWGNYGVSIFCRKHYVVVTQVDTMIIPSILLWLRHTPMVT